MARCSFEDSENHDVETMVFTDDQLWVKIVPEHQAEMAKYQSELNYHICSDVKMKTQNQNSTNHAGR